MNTIKRRQDKRPAAVFICGSSKWPARHLLRRCLSFPDWHIKWMCLIVMYFFIPKAQCSH